MNSIERKLTGVVLLAALVLAVGSVRGVRGDGQSAAPVSTLGPAARALDLPIDAPERGPVQANTVKYKKTPADPHLRDVPVETAPPPPPPNDTEEKPVLFFGQEVKSEDRTVFFVVDVSGSMAYEHRLEHAREELARSISGLGPEWSFGIEAYDCSAYPWHGMALERATVEAKTDAVAWVSALKPGGGTGTGYVLADALKRVRARLFVLLTDGMPSCVLNALDGTDTDCDKHRALIKAANGARGDPARIDVFGMGVPGSGPFRAFVRGVAEDASGIYVDVR